MVVDGGLLMCSLSVNAAGLDVRGDRNPNWRGGLVHKVCEQCGIDYAVKRAHAASRFCGLQCVGLSQRKVCAEWTLAERVCDECSTPFYVPVSHAERYRCCSRACGGRRRAKLLRGEGNPNWNGGISRLPYPWNFREISRRIIARDHESCRSPVCSGGDRRLTTHHINYDKTDCRDENLITLCSSCNSKANFGRDKWQRLYEKMMFPVEPT
jgi:hypothetical protein